MSNRKVKPESLAFPRAKAEPVNPAPRYFRRHRADAVQGFGDGTIAKNPWGLTRRVRKARAKIERLAAKHPR